MKRNEMEPGAVRGPPKLEVRIMRRLGLLQFHADGTGSNEVGRGVGGCAVSNTGLVLRVQYWTDITERIP